MPIPTSYVGQTIRVKFLVDQDGFGALTGRFVDNVQLTLPCGSASPPPAPRATPDAEAAPVAQLETFKVELARDLAGSPPEMACGFERLCVSLTKCLPSKRTLRTLAASIQRGRTVRRPLHLRRPLQPPNPFCKSGSGRSLKNS
jgi:hypothetical protein